MSTFEPTQNPLGDAIRVLLKRRSMKAYELGHEIGLSPTSISKIMNGVSRPRQTTFTRLCQALCEGGEDEQKLSNAFAEAELLVEESDGLTPESEKRVHRLRAEQFLSRKAESIRFKYLVAEQLGLIGCSFEQDYCEGDLCTDFLVNQNGRRLALECKSNTDRDMEKSVAMAELLREQWDCDAWIVTPDFSKSAKAGIDSDIKFVQLSKLMTQLKSLTP